MDINSVPSFKDINVLPEIIKNESLVKEILDFYKQQVNYYRGSEIEKDTDIPDVVKAMHLFFDIYPFVRSIEDVKFDVLNYNLNPPTIKGTCIQENDEKHILPMVKSVLPSFLNNENLQAEFVSQAHIDEKTWKRLRKQLELFVSDKQVEDENWWPLDDNGTVLFTKYVLIAYLKTLTTTNVSEYRAANDTVKRYQDIYRQWCGSIQNITEFHVILFTVPLMVDSAPDEMGKKHLRITTIFAEYYKYDNDGKWIFDGFQKDLLSTPKKRILCEKLIKKHPYKDKFLNLYRHYCKDREDGEIDPIIDIDSLQTPYSILNKDRSTDKKFFVRILNEKIAADTEVKRDIETFNSLLNLYYSLVDGNLIESGKSELFIYRLSGIYDQGENDITFFHNDEKIEWKGQKNQLALIIYFLYNTKKKDEKSRPSYKAGCHFIVPDGNEEWYMDISRLAKSAIGSRNKKQVNTISPLLKNAGFKGVDEMFNLPTSKSLPGPGELPSHTNK